MTIVTCKQSPLQKKILIHYHQVPKPFQIADAVSAQISRINIKVNF